MDALDLRDTIYVGHPRSGMISLLAARAQPTRWKRMGCISASPCQIDDGDYWGGRTQANRDAIYNAMEEDYQGWVMGLRR